MQTVDMTTMSGNLLTNIYCATPRLRFLSTANCNTLSLIELESRAAVPCGKRDIRLAFRQEHKYGSSSSNFHSPLSLPSSSTYYIYAIIVRREYNGIVKS